MLSTVSKSEESSLAEKLVSIKSGIEKIEQTLGKCTGKYYPMLAWTRGRVGRAWEGAAPRVICAHRRMAQCTYGALHRASISLNAQTHCFVVCDFIVVGGHFLNPTVDMPPATKLKFALPHGHKTLLSLKFPTGLQSESESGTEEIQPVMVRTIILKQN